MERELKIRRDYHYNVEKLTVAYEKALTKDWKSFKQFYDGCGPPDLFSPLTVNGDNAFHFAGGSKDPKLVKAFLDKLPNLSEKIAALTTPNHHGNTPLHEVAITNCVEAAQHMVAVVLDRRSWPDNEEENKQEDPKKLVEDPKKLLMRNKLGETPLYRAAALGKTKMVQYLFKTAELQIEAKLLNQHFRRNDEVSILHIAVIGQHFDTAIWLLKKEAEFLGTREAYDNGEEKLAKREEKNGMTAFNLLALMPTAFKSWRPISIWKKFFYIWIPAVELEVGYEEEDKLPSSHRQDLETGKNICQAKNQTAMSKMWRALIQGCPRIMKIWKEKRKHELAVALTKLLVDQDTSWKESYQADTDATISLGLGKGEQQPGNSKDDQKAAAASTEKSNTTTEVSKKKKRSSTEAPIFMAASNGIIEIINVILDKYPQAVDYVSDYGQNMLNATVMHRRWMIFERIMRLEEETVQKLAARIDNFGNTLLHHVADMRYYRGGIRFGPALEFQEELQWFEVKEIMPSHYMMHRNNNRRITAPDFFNEEHSKQHKDAKKWMKDAAQSCSTVSILVATVVFAAAYTVPGGNNEQGLPIFLHSPLFWIFTIMDVVSLITSLSSVVMFLSILTSPYDQEAFLKSLPRKLMGGFLLLFLSVLFSMITFTAALLLLIRLKNRWTTTLLYAAAFVPVLLFSFIQFPFCSLLVQNSVETLSWKFKLIHTKKRIPKYLE
ncbi:putative Ankyrin repeat family protein [Melia azedarach]|uniref:Ankyrin repeat family protein n=1 Tax=Melia azedarach TaxID=155640 RepID=A0ACC1Y0B6_MELAZ|nr:putative Ankyrin repeat family protein [Melia azedarach]